jgi:hypothetical protein
MPDLTPDPGDRPVRRLPAAIRRQPDYGRQQAMAALIVPESSMLAGELAGQCDLSDRR